MKKKAESDHPPQRETRRKTSWATSWETRGTKPREGGHTIQHREPRKETIGNKTGRQDLRESRRTIQHRQTRGDKIAGRRTHHPRRRHHPTQAHMWGDNGRQLETMGNNSRQPETRIDKNGDDGKQDLGKADIPSNTGTHACGGNGRQFGDKTSGRRTDHVGRQ